MHSTTVSSSSTSAPSTTTNIEQYHYPPISTLRRASRPSNINLSIFDPNNPQHSNDAGIYSAPICYIKQPNNSQQHIQQTSHPYTAAFQYQPHHQQQHIQLPSHHHHHPHQQQHNIPLYPQQQQQQQQMVDPFSQHQHTPHTFPLQTSPNHYHQYFYFPPSTLQTSNGHPSTNPTQSSAHNNRLHAVQIQEQQQQQWSNPVLSPLMLKRMNENAASIPIVDDDEDPSASIDALVADVDSSSHDLLDDRQNKSKTSSTTPAGTISPSPHVYLRSTSHILTTPPNPLASDDHPDNQLTAVGNNFQKIFSPIPSAGFELTNNNVKISSSDSTTDRAFFTFDINLHENQHKKNLNDKNEEDNQDNKLIKHPDIRTTKISSNNIIHDDSSNHSSTNSSCHNPTSRIFSQILQSSEQQQSSSPLSTDMKLSSIDSENNQTNINSSTNRHICAHPDCNKTFANKSALAKHKLTHSQDRKHKCSKCNKGFKRLDHLHGHMLTHEEEKPHKCRVPNCIRTYCDARSLKRHIENAHQDVLAAIHQGEHDEYRRFLPETAFVKTKDSSINNEFSIDSVDSNSPRSLVDNEQSFNIRSSTGNKLLTTYTFDEEKCVECHICKKSFKNGAALNGHMRLHGGFNEKQQPSPSSSDNTQKKKRLPTPKRKRLDSPSTSITIKNEEQDIINPYPQQSTFSTLPPCSDFYDRTSSRARSASSSIISTPATAFPQYTIKHPMSVQPPTKPRKQIPLPSHGYDYGMAQFDATGNQQMFPTPIQHSNEKFVKSLSIENRPTNGLPPNYPYIQPSNLPHFPINSSSIPPSLLQQLLRQKEEYYRQQQPTAAFDEANRYTSSPHFVHSSIPNSTLIINTPVSSPYSNPNPTHHSPLSTLQMCNNNNGMQPSPATHSTSSSCSSSSSLHAPKKRFLHTMKQETHDDKQQTTVEDEPSSPAVLKIIPDIDSPVKKSVSGFLIGTPSSTGASSSSSTSSNTHFHYDDIPTRKKPEPTPSSFQWPSQFRRQLSLNIGYQTSNALPSTPYTPPPMLSPFRKGPGLYYRVFSHPGSSAEVSSIPTTPVLPFTPGGEESAGPKINVGKEYQAIIPKLRTNIDDYDAGHTDELLFSPSELSYLDDKSLDKFEQLSRMNPFLFSPRHSPTSYPLELVYMLLHEYNGDLQRTLAALLEGTAKDIKQCRPIHQYRFPECDKWTQEEIDAFTKAIQSSEKNFEFVSRTVGTKSIKQCIEFHYMPKVNITARKMLPKGTSSVMTRRKRFQMIKAKQQQQQQQLDDETSSSSISEFSPMNSNSSPATQFSCDIDDCSRTFTTERACRAHRKDHRRINSTMTTIKRVKH